MIVDDLKLLLADMFAFRLKAQTYHWNVEGPDFMQYHDLFGSLYTQADSNLDTIAEHIRALDSYVIGSFKRLSELAKIQDEETIPSALEMVSRLSRDNQILHSDMLNTREQAEVANQFGVVNFLEGLIDENEKTQWKLKSIVKNSK